MGKTVLMIGATGLVGSYLIEQMLLRAEVGKIRVFSRRKVCRLHPKLEEYVVDFDRPELWAPLVKGDVLFSMLGTTLKKVKTKENQYRIDYTYQYEFAKAAEQNGVPAYVLVSSLGANSKSLFFYSRIKGELDNAVQLLNFKKLVIFRPSVLDGRRKEKRIAEKISLFIMHKLSFIMPPKYRPTPVRPLVSAMINFAFDSVGGTRIVEGSEIF
jgi:uncharacterized protein YbjT (DUF2867 family)